MSNSETVRADPLDRSDGSLCPSFLAAMEVLGKRWNGVLIQVLRDRELRFVDLKSAVPDISDAVLTTRLAELLRCELIERRTSVPGSSRGIYALTEKGLALLPVLDDLTTWSERWVPPNAHRGAPTQDIL